jgi:hypothetical protein
MRHHYHGGGAAAANAARPLTAEAVALEGRAYALPGLLITSHLQSDIGLVGCAAVGGAGCRCCCRGGGGRSRGR